MNTLLTDEEMIRQYLNSHPQKCFETLYSRYVNKVYRRCLSMTKSTEQAEDFTHDIFLKAFTKLNAFQERSSFSTWLYSIAYNYCSDQLRRGKRFTFSSVDEGLKQDIADERETSLHEETALFVKLAISTLSATEQALLQLKYEQNMSIDEIAQIHQLTPSAVKMRLKRSRDKIYQLYNRQLV